MIKLTSGIKIFFSVFLFVLIQSAFAKAITIKIIGINDFHGQITTGKNRNNHPVGGAAVLTSYIKDIEKNNEGNTLIAFSGDQTGASPPASGLLKDEPTILFLNTLGNAHCTFENRLDPLCNVVGTIGNHEFDKGYQNLLEMQNGRNSAPTNHWLPIARFTGANFPFISANIVDAATKQPLFTPYVIKRINGINIGFIGAALHDAANIIVAPNISGIEFLDEAQTINHYLPEMKAKGADIIVVLMHQGGNQKAYEGFTQPNTTVTGEITDIVKKLNDDVDVVMSAHTHQFLNAYLPNAHGKQILVTQAYSYSVAFAELSLSFDTDTHQLLNKFARIITTFADKGPGLNPDKEVSQLIKYAEDNVAPIVNAYIGTSQSLLSKKANRAGESNLGDLIADAFRNVTHADVAFINSGSMRTDISPGDITWGQVYTMLPFENAVIKLSMKGSDIAALLEQQWQNDRTYMLQISGITYSYNTNNSQGHRVSSIKINNQPLQVNQMYSVATNDLLYNGGDNFTMMTKGKYIETDGKDIEALVAYIKSLPQPFNVAIEGRISRE